MVSGFSLSFNTVAKDSLSKELSADLFSTTGAKTPAGVMTVGYQDYYEIKEMSCYSMSKQCSITKSGTT